MRQDDVQSYSEYLNFCCYVLGAKYTQQSGFSFLACITAQIAISNLQAVQYVL